MVIREIKRKVLGGLVSAGKMKSKLILLMFLMKSGAIANLNSSEEGVSYAVLIDAGSSGSRIHVFEIRSDSELGEIPALKLPPHKLKIEPGLSSFASNPQSAGKSLEPLVSFARRKVPERYWRETPIILAATAGVRLLAPDVADLVMRSCLQTLRASPFKVLHTILTDFLVASNHF
jgi:apyrase